MGQHTRFQVCKEYDGKECCDAEKKTDVLFLHTREMIRIYNNNKILIKCLA